MSKVQRSASINLDKAIRELQKKKQAVIGWFETAKYEDGTQAAYIAQILELGYLPKNIPPFSFFRNTIAENENEWRDQFRGFSVRILKGQMTLEQALEGLGLLVAGDVRKTIAETTSPALKESTLRIRRSKGNTSTKPLIDSGFMQSTLTSEVQ